MAIPDRDSRGDNGISQHAELLDFNFDDIAWLQENRWLAEHADSFGCAGGDDVAGLQGNGCVSRCEGREDRKLRRAWSDAGQ